MNKRNKGGQHFRKKVEKNKRERAIENKKKLERLVREAAAEKLARSLGRRREIHEQKKQTWSILQKESRKEQARTRYPERQKTRASEGIKKRTSKRVRRWER